MGAVHGINLNKYASKCCWCISRVTLQKCVTWKVTRCLVFIQAAAAWKLRHDGTDAANEMAGWGLEILLFSDQITRSLSEHVTAGLQRRTIIGGKALVMQLAVTRPAHFGPAEDMTCAAFTCSGNWSQLASASSRVGSDLSTCCQPNCAMFDCKAVGLDSNPAARDRPGSNKEACCLKAAPAVPDPVPAPVTSAPTTPAPVVQTCSTWKCPAGSVVPTSKLKLPDPDDATCCDKKLCRDFECIPGWRRNTSANDSPGDSKEECCTATCQAYHCDLKEGWTSNPDRSHFLASDAETCCLQTCSRHKCSENWVPKAKQDKAGETDLECCDKTCQLHFCDQSAGWKTNVRAASVAANDDISCCTSTCKRHSCGLGWVLDEAKLDEEKDTDEGCCKPTCAQHKCDASAGWAEDPAASNRAATQLIKKPNIDEVSGATDEKCCESESCKKWPDLFQEAKAGCNQTSIHDDCNNMFEKSTEDGLSIFKRCGYLLVSGQVYRLALCCTNTVLMARSAQKCRGRDLKGKIQGYIGLLHRRAMGQSLPKAVTSIVLEEDAGPLFRLGSAEMNGHRPAMEDQNC
eukprot:s822_g3.t1